MIAIPASDVASNIHNMRGFQYTHQIGALLLLFPPFTTHLEPLRSSVHQLISEMQLNRVEKLHLNVRF